VVCGAAKFIGTGSRMVSSSAGGERMRSSHLMDKEFVLQDKEVLELTCTAMRI
jgi:hypothetical protein